MSSLFLQNDDVDDDYSSRENQEMICKMGVLVDILCEQDCNNIREMCLHLKQAASQAKKSTKFFSVHRVMTLFVQLVYCDCGSTKYSDIVEQETKKHLRILLETMHQTLQKELGHYLADHRGCYEGYYDVEDMAEGQQEETEDTVYYKLLMCQLDCQLDAFTNQEQYKHAVNANLIMVFVKQILLNDIVDERFKHSLTKSATECLASNTSSFCDDLLNHLSC